MRRFHLLFLSAVVLDLTGLVLVLLAFADSAATSIPPQDAPPEIAAAHAAAVEQASAQLAEAVIGSAVLGAISSVLILLGVLARRRERAASAGVPGVVIQG